MTSSRIRRCIVVALFIAPAPVCANPAALEARDFQGNPHSVDAYLGQGKWVVLMIWASDCHICNEETPALNAFHEAHKNIDAIVLGLTLDGQARKAQAQAFVDKHTVSFDNLIAEPPSVMAFYTRRTARRWVGTPTFLVYAPDGKLAAQQVGAVEPQVITTFMRGYAQP
jgi:thiol-disulfide isomerase/thioredoxin